ncbi:D-aminoacyl-tRNA deacylase [Natronosalvus vescus]|uniref:D-aminoacyl-tRNA deacylase n=1 Tax=Natronosalvus vescus TaxID=2953881 RepID=UPI002091C1D6|nr:D-aminoacyl-tRNA deacylase [Natronosalvus vescus]
MIAIVESRADRASTHICEHLLELTDWDEREDDDRADGDGGGTYYRTAGAELRSFDDLHLELERPVDAFADEPDLLVFASRHSGNTGPLLTAHCTGNFGSAEFGGDADAVAEACPNALAELLAAFDRYAPDGYDAGLECTHHGPTAVGCPSLFAELGSDDEQWDDPDAARAVARAVLDLRGVSPHRERQLVGFGGNHYVPRFERIVRETPWAVGHVAADWALEAMSGPTDHRAVIEQAFAASNAEHAVIDGEWPALEVVITDLGYRVVSETWVRTVADRPLELVSAVESALGSVDGGVRFGSQRTDGFAVVNLPSELFEAAESVDPDAVWEVVERVAVAFETRNGGSRIGTRAALPASVADASADADGGRAKTAAAQVEAEIVSVAASVLEERYETVTVTDDAVIVEEAAFDPSLADSAGVPEGPKFGRLANGEAVTVDGDVITPSDVCRRRTTSFPR